MDLIRAMPPAERIRKAMSLSNTVRLLTKAHLRKQYPDASEREIFLRTAQITLGKELFARVYGAEAPWLKESPT